MSSELIIIVIGVVFILIAFINGKTSSKAINTKLRIPVGVSGILLLIYVGFSYGAINLQGQIEQPDVGNEIQIDYPIERVQVISPVEGDAVRCRILTKGVYPEAHNKNIWVVLKPSDNKYYPQSDHTNTSYKRNGEWQVITRFGGDQDESYELIVYETDDTASAFFSETIQDWKEALSYPGLSLEELPAGATEVQRVTVTLQDNCRGVF